MAGFSIVLVFYLIIVLIVIRVIIAIMVITMLAARFVEIIAFAVPALGRCLLTQSASTHRERYVSAQMLRGLFDPGTDNSVGVAGQEERDYSGPLRHAVE